MGKFQSKVCLNNSALLITIRQTICVSEQTVLCFCWSSILPPPFRLHLNHSQIRKCNWQNWLSIWHGRNHSWKEFLKWTRIILQALKLSACDWKDKCSCRKRQHLTRRKITRNQFPCAMFSILLTMVVSLTSFFVIISGTNTLHSTHYWFCTQ